MKTKFTFLLLFAACLVFAQSKLFQSALDENQLIDNQKISKELSSTYIATKYYKQPAFNLGSELEIFLPNNKVIRVKVKNSFSYSDKTESFVYAVEGQPGAEFVLSKFDNIVTGMYVSGTGDKFIFHQTDSQTFAISQVNEGALTSRDSVNDFIHPESIGMGKANANVCLASTPVCAATTVDVLVVFTSTAKTAWGGLAQSKSFIATAITNFNTALQNSGVSNVTINLVYSGEIAYTESGVINTDLSRLRTENDTYLDEVQTLRATYGADLCALVTGTPTNTCGLGYLNTNPTNYSASNAYTVTLYNCVVSNYSLAHEMGHNMGLNHDWYVNQSTAPCEHQHGYTNKTAITLGSTSTAAQRWRTIMAYNNECADKGFSCTRINRWANPGVNYNTEPTGVAIGSTNPADEAFGFSRFACVVSQFMPTKVLAVAQTKASDIDFTLFPNPAKDELNVHLMKDGNYSYKITNLVGQMVLKSAEKKINIKGLSTGPYILSIYNVDGALIGTKKFIVK